MKHPLIKIFSKQILFIFNLSQNVFLTLSKFWEIIYIVLLIEFISNNLRLVFPHEFSNSFTINIKLILFYALKECDIYF